MRQRLMVAAALMVVAPMAGAAAALAHEHSEQTVIKSREFTVPKGQCSQLPADLELRGLGLERTTTVVERADQGGRHDEDGRISYSLVTRITGTATDNFGGRYTFSYELRLKKPIALPGPGIIVDTFKLKGTGAADGMATFFRARVTFDSGANPIGFELVEQTGEPSSCDPL